ncbi:MAG: ATP-binding cassette domain-containing protein [Candidatus Poribacteria bacterium]|nr:ATP-binding cassette domain-containing protein [Candidatus Poribacteria bacterium]
MIVARELHKTYRLPGEDIHALKGIDLSVREGEFVVVMGPSGAGKTTLLNLVGGLDDRTSGGLEIDGR